VKLHWAIFPSGAYYVVYYYFLRLKGWRRERKRM